MSHICCIACHSNEHYQGYGLAAGGIGAYTICECGEILEFKPDEQYADHDEQEQNDG